MLVVQWLRSIELFLSSSLENFEETFSIKVDRVYQVYRIVDKALLDHVVKHCLGGEGRRGVDLKKPALEVFVNDYVESIQIETARIKGDVILSSD